MDEVIIPIPWLGIGICLILMGTQDFPIDLALEFPMYMRIEFYTLSFYLGVASFLMGIGLLIGVIYRKKLIKPTLSKGGRT